MSVRPALALVFLLVAPAAAAPSFGVRIDLPAPINPSDVAIADLNADGAPDLVLLAPGSPTSLGQIVTWYGRGDGYFWPGPTTPCLRAPDHPALGDLNGDPYPDLVFCGGLDNANGDQSVEIAVGNGDGSFTEVMHTSGSNQFFHKPVIADFDEDGRNDVAVAHSDFGGFVHAPALLYPGNGDGTVGTALPLGGPTDGFDLAAGDLDDNGTLDLALATSRDTTSFLLQDPEIGWIPRPGPQRTNLIVLGRFDGDSLLDQAYAYNLTQLRMTIRFGGSGASFDIPLTSPTRTIAVCDLDRDGADDVLTTSDIPGEIDWRAGHNNGAFDAPVAYQVGTRPISIAVGDLNGDGLLDLVASNNGAASVTVLLQGNPVIGAQAGAGRFELSAPFPNPSRGVVSLRFDLASPEPCTILVHDVRGRLVESRTLAHHGAGPQSIRLFESARPPAGIYWTTLRQGLNSASRRFVVLP